MKLAEHVEVIRKLIDQAFRNRLGRMGITAAPENKLNGTAGDDNAERSRIAEIRAVLLAETGSTAAAYEKLVEEFTFTLFNRLAALMVMEAHTLHPEIVARRSQHGDRSFAHVLWLEQNPAGRSEEQEGLLRFFENQLASLSAEIPLFSLQHPYHLLPTAIELNGIMNAFNQIAVDAQVEPEIWQSDDVLGWLYESYNNVKKKEHKDSKAKTEYNKVSIQSQVYTPRWVVKFLVDNSLGKLYLEMYPGSDIKNRYKIANAPKTQVRQPKSLTEIRLIDPATGSGNFLLYAFDLFYDFYQDQIENYGADYDERKIPELILQHNLHGVDLDDRAVQLTQLGLYIKAKRRRRSAKVDHFNVVSSDFFLPDFDAVKHLFDNGEKLQPELAQIVIDIWRDLQQAHKFGSLLRIEEKFNENLRALTGKKGPEENLFEQATLADYEKFRETFFGNLQKAVTHNAERQGITFLNTKTQDAITYLDVMTQKYDVAVANPPYTDSSDFGPELKKFVDVNYKQPFQFNANLYATFICRCNELTNERGKMALIHPLTFMYVKSFEDVRKFIIDKLHINVFVDYGLSNLFDGVMVDPAFYVLEKEKTTDKAWFIARTLQEKYKKENCLAALDDFVFNRVNKQNYLVNQSKLKLIKGWPLIYWFSDGFRKKFKEEVFENYFLICNGISSGGNNERFYRYLWEVKKQDISMDYVNDGLKWVRINKGGEYNKWYGNLWLLFEWENNGRQLKELKKTVSSIRYGYEEYYFQEGLSFTAISSKGMSVRYQPPNCIFERAGKSIFRKLQNLDYFYALAFLNSKLCGYVIDALNPTVNVQSGDIERIPFIIPDSHCQSTISALSSLNVKIKEKLSNFRLIEIDFSQTPISCFPQSTLFERLAAYLYYENNQLTLVMINESIIDQLILNLYDLSKEDRNQIDAKMGKPVGELPVLPEAREAYLAETSIDNETVKDFIKQLCEATFTDQQKQAIIAEFPSLYQANNDLEEFCIRHQVNPINVWYWFRESKVLPPGRAAEIALEFVADACRSILMEDEDGIIPLVGLPGESRLLDRLEQYCLAQGFTSAQFSQLDGLFGRPLAEYLEHHFFSDLSDHLNLFPNMPKTPFIWHLSSGVQQGFEAYIIIYKWNRDSLYKLKSHYLSKRVENLEYRQVELADSNTAQAQAEKEHIRLQLQEIADFTRKVDELIADGYDPKLDDGVGKNIALLQKKGMLRCDVLNAKQLEKYLKADW